MYVEHIHTRPYLIPDMFQVKFTNVATGIAVQHAFVITLQQIQCENVGICVDMGAEDVSGSMSLIDSSCDVSLSSPMGDRKADQAYRTVALLLMGHPRSCSRMLM